MPNEQTSVPLYAASEVLTAANMNISAGTGVPVFATTVTRDAAFGGAGEKVLAEGQLCYLSATNVVQYYDGAAWLAVAGAKCAQVVSTTKTDTFTSSSASYTDVTGLSVSITPTASSSKILVLCNPSGSGQAGVGDMFGQLMRDSTAIGNGAAAGSRIVCSMMFGGSTGSVVNPVMVYLDSPATTSATTYKIQIRNSSGATGYINRSKDDTDSAGYPRSSSSITVIEVLA